MEAAVQHTHCSGDAGVHVNATGDWEGAVGLHVAVRGLRVSGRA